MKTIIEQAIEECRKTGDLKISRVSEEIEKALLSAGYRKTDPLSEDLARQLEFALKDFREDMKKVSRTVELFKLTDEKAEFILKVLDDQSSRKD